jgi:outer membrane protein assembly factor BamB
LQLYLQPKVSAGGFMKGANSVASFLPMRQRSISPRTIRWLFLALLLAGSSARVTAEHTRQWRQSGFEEFLRGTAHGVAVRSDGRLELAPKFTLLADADASYLWSLRLDSKGALFAAGGAPAKVFRFDASGKPSVVFESTDLSAQAIAFDSHGVLYVATSPDGKVYRVSPSGEKNVFFDPKTKYIWDLAFGADGTLYVATGDKGQVFAVNPDGKGDVFYTSDEAHIRVLAFDTQKNLIAGTEPSGRILRITRGSSSATSPGATGFVLYETSKREITSLAVAPDGSIYASSIGEKQRAAGQSSISIISSAQGATSISGGAAASSIPPQAQPPFVAFPPLLSSSIYRISPDGVPEELWSSRDEIVYSIGLGSDGRLLAGTGSNGALLVIDGRGVYAQLAKAGSAQITGIARNSSGTVFLCAANPGKVYSLGPDYEAEGTFETASFDAKLFSQWGRLEWWSPPPATTEATAKKSSASSDPRLEFFVRSGNTEDPGKEWSRWFGPYSASGSVVEAPSARFVQWKAVLHGGRPGDGIDWVTLAYLPRNVAPVIDSIVMQDTGVRAQIPLGMVSGQGANVNLKMPLTPGLAGLLSSQSNPAPKFDLQPQGVAQKGYQSVLWSAHDENDDELRYAVFFRGEKERDWKLLKDNLDQKFFAWDTTGMPDGPYYLKIVASDSPSNPPASALKTERESERFEVDNTPPLVEKLQAVASNTAGTKTAITVRFTAADAASSIAKAQYSVDGGEWTLVSPVGAISDSPSEHYEFTLPDLAPGEHTISVRVYDRFDNIGSAKTTVSR